MEKFIEPFENKILLLVIAGITSVVVYSLQFAPLQAFSVFSVGITVAGSALMTGGLFGFLFGIPRIVQSDQTLSSQNKQDNNLAVARYQANTNLEQISDWLTKILIGVGLTQIPQIREEIQRLISFLAPGLGGTDSSASFAFALLVYFSICGFLIGYLTTRLRLANALREVDEVLKHISQQLEAQQEKDANALALVDRQLDLRHPEIHQTELDQAIASASSPIKVQIFRIAHRTRKTSWREDINKPQMERTIPIFRALLKDDPEHKFHRNHAELAFALKDKQHSIKADYREAEAELNTAIAMRGERLNEGWSYYEFNRALCRIELYGDDPRMQDTILDDLAKAAQDNFFFEEMLDELRNWKLKSWLKDKADFQALLSRSAN
jgi:tetratricopeptide (TPR) repeat protein